MTRTPAVLLLTPSLAVLAVFALALGALFALSLVEFIPGSLRTGGLTAQNFRVVLSPQYLRYIGDTVVLSAATTALTLLAAYPVAYALGRARSRGLRSLILAAALSHIDPFWERAAASLGARPARVFWRVTLPLSMPGVASGCLVVFAWTFSALPTPELLGGGRVKMIANVVKDLALDAFNWPGSAAFAAGALGLTLGLLIALGRVFGRLAA